MKKRNIVGVLFIWLVLSLSMVSAATPDLERVKEGIIQVIEFFVGSIDYGSVPYNIQPSEIIFVKFLVFILLLAIINTIIRRIHNLGNRKGIAFIIAFAISLLSVRFLTTAALVNFIWLPQGVLALVLGSLLPFIIAFLFFEGFDSEIIRKVGWSSFVVIFGGLAALRWQDLLSDIRIGNTNWQVSWALVYLAIAALSFLLIVFDGKIRAMYLLRTLDRHASRDRRIQAAHILRDIKEDQELLSHTEDEETRREIKDRIRDAQRRVVDVLQR